MIHVRLPDQPSPEKCETAQQGQSESTVPHSRGIWHKRLACLIVDWKQRQGESKFKTILGYMRTLSQDLSSF